MTIELTVFLALAAGICVLYKAVDRAWVAESAKADEATRADAAETRCAAYRDAFEQQRHEYMVLVGLIDEQSAAAGRAMVARAETETILAASMGPRGEDVCRPAIMRWRPPVH